MVRSRALRWLTAVAALTCASGGGAYWAPNHMEINQQVAKEGLPFNFQRGGHTVKTLDDYIRYVLLLDGGDRVVKAVQFTRATPFLGGNGDQPTDDPDATFTLRQWLIQGGLWEDGFSNMDEGTCWGGYRAVNHFHNPIALDGNGGYHGFVDTPLGVTVPYLNLLRTGTSATVWASGGSNGPQQNFWGTPAVKDGFTQYFTEDDVQKRQKGVGNAFRALGQVMHLIEDNTVPDHARDLPHPGNGFEEYMQGNQKSLFAGTRPVQSWNLLPLSTVEKNGLRAFWDQDLYTASPSAAAVGSQAGISEITNANFLAFNDFAKLGGVIRIWFARIPGDVHTGYVNNDDHVSLPYPQIDAPVTPNATEPTEWNTTADTYPVSPGAYGRTTFSLLQTPVWILNDAEWLHYAQPLMQLAHGYAQSLLTLMMPPVDAEIVPDPSDPLHKAVVRLWNLGGDARLGNGVTWHITQVRIKAIQPKAPSQPFLTNITAPIPVGFSNATIPADSQGHDSDSFTLSWSQRFSLMNASHTAVEIDADVGTANPVHLSFGVMIPNAYASVEQQSAQSSDPPGNQSITDSCGNTCSPTWTNSAAGQWLHQNVKGIIKTYPAKLDPLGKVGEAPLRQGQQDIAHVAGMAIVISDEMRGIDQWRFLSGSTLTLTGSQLQQAAGSNPVWVRTKSSDRTVAEPSQTGFQFNVPLDQNANSALAPDLSLTNSNIFLAVFTTSGNMVFLKVALWFSPVNETVTKLITGVTCPIKSTTVTTTSSNWSFCQWGGGISPCTPGMNVTGTGRSIQMNVPVGPPITQAADAQVFFLSQFPSLLPLQLQQKNVPVGAGNVPTPCGDPQGILKGGIGPCLLGGGIVYDESTLMDMNTGPCGNPSPPPAAFTPSATLTRDDSKVQALIQTELGQTVPPAITVNLQ